MVTNHKDMPNSTPDPQLDLPRDIIFGEVWNTSALRKVVDKRCHDGRKPSHLFLGRREAALLRTHLGEAFGPETVQTFNDIYYMGMLVVELETPTCVRVAGEKFMDRLESKKIDLGKWKEDQFSEWELVF